MIAKAIVNNYKTALLRKWDKTYWAFDIHETIIIPNYKADHIPKTFYPNAKKVLQQISKRKDITMMLYTCSHPHEIEEYQKYFAENDIIFTYVNENPEVVTGKSTDYGNYDKKPYFNVLFENKAGFDAMQDWFIVEKLLKQYDENLLLKFRK
jgi:hypothetical protein